MKPEILDYCNTNEPIALKTGRIFARIMIGASFACGAHLGFLAILWIHPEIGDEDLGLAGLALMGTLFLIGLPGAIVGAVALAKSDKRNRHSILFSIFVGTVLIDAFLFIVLLVKGVGMG